MSCPRRRPRHDQYFLLRYTLHQALELHPTFNGEPNIAGYSVAIVFSIEQNVEIYEMITYLGIGHYNNNESSQNQVTTHDELNQMNTQQSVNPNQDTQENTHNFAKHNGVLTNNVDEIMCTNPCSQGQKEIPTIDYITSANNS